MMEVTMRQTKAAEAVVPVLTASDEKFLHELCVA